MEMPAPAMVAIFLLNPSSTTSRHPARRGLKCPDSPPRPTSLIGDCSLEEIGVNHVALNLRFNQADTEDTLKRLADDILPEFSHV